MQTERAGFPNFSLVQYQGYLRRMAASPKIKPALTPAVIRREVRSYRDLQLSRGDFVVFRGDFDGRDDGIYEEKLDSNLGFLRHAVEQGWNVIMLGHRRRPEAEDSSRFLAGETISPSFLHDNPSFSDLKYLADKLGRPIAYVEKWLAPGCTGFTPEFTQWVEAARGKEGESVFLENDRLWPQLYDGFNDAAKEAEKGDSTDLDQIAALYYQLGQQLQTLEIKGYVYDAISAAKQACGSKSAFAPFVPQVGVGPATLAELLAIDGLLAANIYYLSGAKVSEKLPAAVEMIKAGRVPLIITGGVVGFALRYAELVYKQALSRNDGLLGALSSAAHKLHISPQDVDDMLAAYRVLEEQGRLDPLDEKGGVLNPVDFRSASDPARVVDFTTAPLELNESQFDIGPTSISAMQGAINRRLEEGSGGVLMVISGTPGVFEKEGYAGGFTALRAQAERVLDLGGRVIGTGSEGNLVCPRGEHVIAGGVAGMFAAGTTPAAFRVLLPGMFPVVPEVAG